MKRETCAEADGLGTCGRVWAADVGQYHTRLQRRRQEPVSSWRRARIASALVLGPGAFTLMLFRERAALAE